LKKIKIKLDLGIRDKIKNGGFPACRFFLLTSVSGLSFILDES